ncbi:MAG: hypothetical protein E7Z70_02165 [Thermoplasmata archaeon]|nr:hypothetical protein [Thermoplasmata archaeon]
MKPHAFVPLIIAALVLFPSSLAVVSDGQDVDYIDPPAADVVFQINQSLNSDDPTFTVRFDSDYSEAAGEMAKDVRMGLDGISGNSVSESHCLPSWITFTSSKYANPGNQIGMHYYLDVSISPALQQVSEDTHGEYWIFFNYSYSGLLSSENVRYLIKISLDVHWNGSVIVKDQVWHTYALIFDSLGGDVTQTYYTKILSSDDTGICYFDTTSVVPSRPGYTFLGWSTVNASDGTAPLDVADDYPFVAVNADSVNSRDPNNIIYSKTLYAVWGFGSIIPNSWDELLALMLDPLFLIISCAVIIALAFFARKRRLGGYY